MSEKSQNLNPAAFATTVFGIVVLHKLASFLTPYKLYFSFSSFLYNQSAINKWPALVVKLLIPTLFAFAFYVVVFRILEAIERYGREIEEPLDFVRDAAEPSLKFGALFAAILLAWPFLVYWDVLIEPTLRDRRIAFLFAYLLYFAAYYFFAGFGVQLAKLYLSRSVKSDLLKADFSNFSWMSPLKDGAAGAVSALAATAVTSLATWGQP